MNEGGKQMKGEINNNKKAAKQTEPAKHISLTLFTSVHKTDTLEGYLTVTSVLSVIYDLQRSYLIEYDS